MNWVQDRVPQPPVEAVIKSALRTQTEGYTHQLHYYYPRQGGHPGGNPFPGNAHPRQRGHEVSRSKRWPGPTAGGTYPMAVSPDLEHRVQQSEHHLGDAGGIIALREAHGLAKMLAQAQAIEEVMEQNHTTKPGQTCPREGDSDAPGTSAVTQYALQKARNSGVIITPLTVRLSGQRHHTSLRRAQPCPRRI